MNKLTDSLGFRVCPEKIALHGFFFLLFFFLSSTDSFAQFITTWRTTDDGETITIPTYSGLTYNYTVDWGDGSQASTETGDATHTYATAGDYTVSITGTFPGIYINNNDVMRHKILSIEQWGNNAWARMDAAFEGADLLVCNATDVPDLSHVTDLSDMFKHTSKFTGNLNNWDVSGISNMSGMFYDSPIFNGDLNNWNVSAVTNMSEMFYYAQGFNGNIDNWNVEKVTDMYQMFAGANIFNRDISGWNVSGVTDMEGMFNGATIFNQDISVWNVSAVTNMSHMFSYARHFNRDISGWDVSKVVDMNHMFDWADDFDQNLGSWNLSSVNGKYPVYGMSGMLDNSGLDTPNYDNTLVGWNNGGYADNDLGALGLVYCTDGQAARNSLLANGWTITGDEACAALPVEMLSFEASVGDHETVKLTWETASEKANEGFEIQRSAHGKMWNAIGFQKSAKNNTTGARYFYLDKNPNRGTNYYRLKQLDLDGNFHYSTIVSAKVNGKSPEMEVYPNPSAGEIQVDLGSDGKETTMLVLSDYTGKVIWEKTTAASSLALNINDAGVYLLSARTAGGVVTKKIIVNRN